MGRQRTRGDRSLRDDRSLLDRRAGADGATADRSTADRSRSVVGRTRRGTVAPDERTDPATDDPDAVGAGAGDPAASEPETVVRVDRDKLTDRQLEVLRTAHDMGYYEYPRGANATEVAAALDICPSTLAEHLAAAQSKLLGDVLDESAGE